MSWVQVLNADYPFKWNVYPAHATPLYYAASFGLTNIVLHLLDYGAELDIAGSRFGGTALHAAAWRGYVDTASVLLERSADPNQADWDGVTPLHSAASCGNLEMISLLLENGASRELRDRDGEVAYQWAVNAGFRHAQMLIGFVEGEESHGLHETVQAQVPRAAVWSHPKSFYPSWYDKRSGMTSSIVVEVQTVSDYPLR